MKYKDVVMKKHVALEEDSVKNEVVEEEKDGSGKHREKRMRKRSPPDSNDLGKGDDVELKDLTATSVEKVVTGVEEARQYEG